MRRLLSVTLALLATTALAQIQPGSPLVPSGSGTGGGGGGVTSIATTCGVTGGTITTSGTISAALPKSTNAGLTTSSTTLAAADCGTLLVSNNTGGTQTLTLSNFSAGNFAQLQVNSTAGGAVTLSPSSGSVIGPTTIQPGQSVGIQFDGTNWNIQPPFIAGTGVISALGNSTASNGSFAYGLIYPGYITGNNEWYLAAFPGFNPGTGAAGAANTVYCVPVYLASAVTIKALGSDVTTLFSGGHEGWAIYTNVSSRPGALVDFANPGSTTTATTINGAMHNGTDTVGPGIEWFCASPDNATSVIAGFLSSSGAGAITIGSTSQTQVGLIAGITVGVSCAVSTTTCGGTGSGWAPWSAGVFTWGVGSTATWSNVITSVAPMIEFQVQ